MPQFKSGQLGSGAHASNHESSILLRWEEEMGWKRETLDRRIAGEEVCTPPLQ